MIADEDLADHVDLNFGCPVPKVTRRGGGSALPYKRNLLRAILREAVGNAGTLPVTMKMRKGIDDDHLTYLDAGRIAVEEGVSAIALHGRTAIQHYGGTADWEAIARLKEAVPEIPVLGNGDIWSADDARRMMDRTGCDGVVVGRGCLGRPWLFADLAAMCDGRDERLRPGAGRGRGDHGPARDADGRVLRQRVARGGRLPQARRLVSQGLRRRLRPPPRLATSETLAGLREGLAELDPDQPWPEGADVPRGKTNPRDRVHLPAGWLDDPYDLAVPGADAELETSGG